MNRLTYHRNVALYYYSIVSHQASGRRDDREVAVVTVEIFYTLV